MLSQKMKKQEYPGVEDLHLVLYVTLLRTYQVRTITFLLDQVYGGMDQEKDGEAHKYHQKIQQILPVYKQHQGPYSMYH